MDSDQIKEQMDAQITDLQKQKVDESDWLRKKIVLAAAAVSITYIVFWYLMGQASHGGA